MKSYKLVAIALLLGMCWAGDWRTGKLVSFDESTTSDESGGQVLYTDPVFLAVVDDGEYQYFGRRELKSTFQRKPQFTENSEVKWKLSGRKLILVDDSGREFSMSLVKRRKD